MQVASPQALPLLRSHSLTSVTWAIESGYLNVLYCHVWGQHWRRWLRHCATSRKVTGSIPYGFVGILYWHKLCGHTVGSASNKRVPGIFPKCKGGQCVWLTTLPPLCAECIEIWEPQPPGILRACAGIVYLSILSQWGLNAVPLSCHDAWDRIIYWAELMSGTYRGKSNTHEQERARGFSHITSVMHGPRNSPHKKTMCSNSAVNSQIEENA